MTLLVRERGQLLQMWSGLRIKSLTANQWKMLRRKRHVQLFLHCSNSWMALLLYTDFLFHDEWPMLEDQYRQTVY